MKDMVIEKRKKRVNEGDKKRKRERGREMKGLCVKRKRKIERERGGRGKEHVRCLHTVSGDDSRE